MGLVLPAVMNAQTLRNGSNTKIGTIESNGTVRNGSNTKIGTAQGVKRQWAAAFFFDFFNR